MYIHIKIIKETHGQASCPQWIGLLVKVQKFYKAATRSLSVYEHKAILTAILTSRFNMRM